MPRCPSHMGRQGVHHITHLLSSCGLDGPGVRRAEDVENNTQLVVTCGLAR